MKFHSIANIFPMMSASEYAALLADIRENGQREPIWTYDGQIIDGRNRYQVCTELGITPRCQAWDGQGSLTAFVVSLNLHRRHLSESQRAMIGAKIRPMFEDEARERQLSTLKHSSVASANLQQRGRASDHAATSVQVSTRSVDDASRVLREGTPALVSAVESGILPVSQAARLVSATPERQQQIINKLASGEAKNANIAARQIRYESMDEPEAMTGRYRVVYADPPWSYGNSGPIGETDNYGHAERHYPSMTVSELCALPVAEILEDDAVLFLWVTSPLLEDAFPVIKAWGFKYKSSFVWDKVRHNFGYYNSVRHEFLLICTRGSCTPDTSELIDSVQEIERSTKHSEKPTEFRALIEKLYSRGHRIELFARIASPGWVAWGNQAERLAV